MATSGDLHLATSGDFYMATDTPRRAATLAELLSGGRDRVRVVGVEPMFG